VSDTPKPSATVVVIRDADALEVLLLERQRGNAWVFPGGKLDAADGPLGASWEAAARRAAVREAREEAGVDGKVISPAGSMSFELGDITYRVNYFVLTTGDLGKEREGRRFRWCRYKQAMRRLSFDETRDLLREAWPRIQSAVSTASRGNNKKK
jgi:8-oxo-dGTP pyrophosphatase MutT (NUDIX family)